MDNLSRINEEMSDAFCRAVTGEAAAKRSLYTDDELHVVGFRRALLLTSIDTGGIRRDLAERQMPVELERIKRVVDEGKLMAAYERRRPAVLGGLLDLLAAVQANPVRVKNPPRMADAAGVMASLDKVTGSSSLPTYRASLGSASEQVLESDPVAAGIIALVGHRGEFFGTATELYEALRPFATEHGWPANERSLSSRLKRVPRPREGARNQSGVHTLGATADPDFRTVRTRKTEAIQVSVAPSQPSQIRLLLLPLLFLCLTSNKKGFCDGCDVAADENRTRLDALGSRPKRNGFGSVALRSRRGDPACRLMPGLGRARRGRCPPLRRPKRGSPEQARTSRATGVRHVAVSAALVVRPRPRRGADGFVGQACRCAWADDLVVRGLRRIVVGRPDQCEGPMSNPEQRVWTATLLLAGVGALMARSRQWQ